jgi:hypothetical protein|tara:strand:+ start:52 stop:651 length:600 start_codon:yes stop_codon:yes gene_type:complete
MPTKLLEVLKFLNSISIAVSEGHEDGRVNSIDDEDTIIDLLIEKYGEENIIKPPPRCWWDVKIFGYYFNIKSSKYGTAADNFSSKAAILYALTDLSEDKLNVSSWKKFQDALINHGGQENNRDYYIFSLNKTNNEVHLTSLKSLRKLTANGNNLPFQIKWKDNTQSVQRTYGQAYDFLVGSYKESVRKKITAHDGFEQL